MFIYSGMTLNYFMEDYLYIFILAVVTFVLSILLRALTVTALQGALLLAYSITEGGIIPAVLAGLQILITILTLYKIFKAINMNYLLVLEKTHEISPNLITDEHRGSRFSFWNTK
ncbi:hypothetical protein GCM10009001_16010 [Virgibacillus siamensis]|uniref:Uncharacterized protein n=1 Tax=Virgibacillus siamensis TaxID=480071 RepID=A0ABN1FZ24_9BACI